MEEHGAEEKQEKSEQRGQHACRTLQQLLDHFSGQQPPLMVERTKSGFTRSLGGRTAQSATSMAEVVNTAAAMPKTASVDNQMAMRTAITMPERIAKPLLPEPTTLKQVKDSRKGLQ